MAEAYRASTPEGLFDLVADYRLHWEPAAQVGIVLYMLTGVGTSGRVGVTAIGNSAEHAQELYDRLVFALGDGTGG